MNPLAIWPLVRTFAPLALIAALIVALLLTRSTNARHVAELAQAKAAFERTVADVNAMTARAKADDAVHAATVEARQTAITKETSDALSTRLADAQRLADAYRVRLSAAAHRGGGSGAPVSETAVPAGNADGTSQAAVVDDIGVCTANTVKALGWKDWWAAEQSIGGIQ